VPVATVDEVLARALAGPLTPIEWNEEEAPLAAATPPADDAEAVITH
jgi:ATP-dependent Lon protease